jgi:tetratricopeptide (TPR) repeat protein
MCELQTEAPGFTIRKMPLARYVGNSGMVNVGTILLHPAVAAEGGTLSVVDASIPDKAKKQLEKGQKEAKKGKIASALAMFQKLATSYPRFALAWIELGRTQALQSQTDAARLSFHEALQVDQKLVTPYMGLSEIAMREGHWQELVDASGKLLELEPASYPQFWFFNAIGYYNLHNFDKAEGSLLRGLAYDPQHKLPKMEYLMGLVLEYKHNYQGAAQRFASYLKFSPDADDAVMAQKQLKDCESAVALAVKGSE